MIINTTNGFNMIEVNSRPDCQDFSCLYDRLQGTHLLNPSKSEVKKLLTTHPERPLILSGHGDDNGLYNHLWNGYLISSKDVELLRKQQVIIGVWCFAGNFADRYGLKGFFTSMFIYFRRITLVLQSAQQLYKRTTVHLRMGRLSS